MAQDPEDHETEDPPEEVKEEFEQIRPECIQSMVAESEIFPPEMLSLRHGSAVRFHVLMTILRYRIAHRAIPGLGNFRSLQGKRQICYEWTKTEMDTTKSQINEHVQAVYSPHDDPQNAFGEHLKEFVDYYEQRESNC